MTERGHASRAAWRAIAEHLAPAIAESVAAVDLVHHPITKDIAGETKAMCACGEYLFRITVGQHINDVRAEAIESSLRHGLGV